MDIEKLIEQAKKDADFEDYPVVASWAAIVEKKHLREYATTLSTLQAENEKLRAELEQVKRERDAAVKAIERVRSCKDCGNYTGEWTPPCKECQDSEEHHPYFKWRGPQKEG